MGDGEVGQAGSPLTRDGVVTASVAAASVGGAAAGSSGLSRGWATLFRFAAVVAGALLLVAGYMLWRDAPEAQIATVGTGGKETVVATKTTTTAKDGTETVEEAPVVAVGGRSVTVVTAFLLLGTLLLVAAALPGRNLTVKAGSVFEAILTAAAATKSTEAAAVKRGADPTTVQAAGAMAAQEAAARLPMNLERARPTGRERALGALSRSRRSRVRDPSVAASKAVHDTIEEAREVALHRALGET